MKSNKEKISDLEHKMKVDGFRSSLLKLEKEIETKKVPTNHASSMKKQISELKKSFEKLVKIVEKNESKVCK
jgi:hypothetical protein